MSSSSLDDDVLIERFVDPIAKVFPTFRREHIEEAWVSRDPVAQPVIEAGYQRRKPPYASPIPGFYICNTAQIYPRTGGRTTTCGLRRSARRSWKPTSRDWSRGGATTPRHRARPGCGRGRRLRGLLATCRPGRSRSRRPRGRRA